MNECSQEVQVRCGCRRIIEQVPCHQMNTIKNYRLPCDETCAEIKKDRLETKPTVVEEEEEEIQPIVEQKTPVNNRKNRKRTTETVTTNVVPPTPKKIKPRRFIWTLNKVILLFSVFSIVTVLAIIYMLKEIS